MNQEFSRRIGRGLREHFEKTVVEPLPEQWLEMIARVDAREQGQQMPPIRDPSQRGRKTSDYKASD
jgi:hypothetical protein